MTDYKYWLWWRVGYMVSREMINIALKIGARSPLLKVGPPDSFCILEQLWAIREGLA